MIVCGKVGVGGLILNEIYFLNVLKEFVVIGNSLVDELFEWFYGDWNGDLNKIYFDYSY